MLCHWSNCDFDNSGTITRIDYDAFAQTEQPNEFVTQGLVDIQVNGFAGVDFSNPGLTAVQMDHALAHLAASGVTCVLPTLITATETEFLSSLEALDKAVSDSDLGPLMVPGYHIEGTIFIAHRRLRRRSSSKRDATGFQTTDYDLQAVSSRPILILTVAPEQDGVLDLIPFLTKQGITCAIGHTAASRTEIKGRHCCRSNPFDASRQRVTP